MQQLTPKEEAIQLVEKYLEFTNDWEDVEHQSLSNRLAIRAIGSNIIKAKKCAIICVDKILESDPTTPILDSDYWENYSDRIDLAKNHYQQVLQEISKL